MSIWTDHVNNRITQDGSPVWRDLTSDIVVRQTPGVGVPTWTTGLNGGPFAAYQFDINEEVWIAFHMDHDYHPGSSFHIHTHWMTDGTSTNTVKWQLTYSVAKGHNQSAFNMTGTTVNIEQAAQGTAWRHMVTESTAISSSELEVDSLILVNVKRITNGGTDNSDNVYLLTADIHYQASYLGTKNKAPNFYT
jgi:hypothetical protein